MKDFRDYEVSGATPAALQAFEGALAAYQSWRAGAEAQLARALREAPGFTMAHVLRAYLRLCSRDVARVRLAHAAYAQLRLLPANGRERLHVAAIGAALADDWDTLRAMLGTLLQSYPRDVLALQVGHALDYVSGDSERMGERVRSVLPAWSPALPGYHAVLAMHAFALAERAQYEQAVDSAMCALQHNEFDARAHHAVAHVYEMTGGSEAGARWMRERIAYWAGDTVAAIHCWWHWALFCLAQGEPAAALALYDERVRAARSHEVADLIDAAALLWRIELLGQEIGARWLELAFAWSQRIADGFCSFNDVHAMLAFAGAHDWHAAHRLEAKLARAQHLPTRHGETTRAIGLPACRAIAAFGRGDYARAAALLAALPEVAHRIGGSHAQRHVFQLTLRAAKQRMQRQRLLIAA